MKSLIECVKHNCKILNKYEVEYLLVGGTAVAIHGYSRLSKAPDGTVLGKHDLDFWYNPTYENYFKLLKALKEIGFESDFLDEEEPNPRGSFFKHEFEDYKLDFLPKIKGLERFNKSYKKGFIVTLEGVDLPVISYNDLISSKEYSNREKDKIDIEMLRKNRNSNS